MKGTLFLLLISFSLLAFPNGGPIDGSAVYKTGDIILVNRPSIELVKEDLSIVIEGDYSLVDVTYHLRNKRYGDEEITYGFPVQFIRDDHNYKLEWKEEYVPRISFTLDGKPLEITHQIDIAIDKVQIEKYREMEVDMRRSWHVVDFTIPKGDSVVLEVSYKVKNGFVDWGVSKTFFNNYGERKMTYNFSPAQYWGYGTVANLAVKVDATNVIDNGESFSTEGMLLNKNQCIYTYEFAYFNFKKAKDLTIIYTNKTERLSAHLAKRRLDNSRVKSITTSSQLPGNYQVANLLDMDFQTAWVEGKKGDGIGEKIVIELDDYQLAAICMVNGYTKSSNTYHSNNRVKKLRLEREVINYDDSTKIDHKVEIVDLDDLDFVYLTENNFGRMVSILGDYGLGFEKVKKITLTILEVHEGSTYDDTCVSEILLLGYR
ncbi:MAG: DUF4424 family protein [Bacteroidota bacterium]